MITLKKLAELSGFSIRTVSRILNGRPNVREEKRDLVLQLAAKHHYVPNMAARNLRLRDKRFVGILFNRFINNTELVQLNVLNETLTEKGYSPILGRIRTGRADECIRKLSNWAGSVDYVIVMHFLDEETETRLREAAKHLPLRLIFADCAIAAGEWDVVIDRAGAIAGMLRQLKERGYRKILHCGHLQTRLDGLALAARQPWAKEMILSHLDVPDDDGYAIGDEVMKSGADALFLDTDRMAVGFYCYAARHGIRIPEDIAVVGFDNEVFAELLVPPLATFSHPAQLLAERICNIVATGKRPPNNLLPMTFIERGSIGQR